METAQNVAIVPQEGRLAWGWLVPAGLLAAVAAAVANTLIYFAASGLGFITRGFVIRMTSGGMPFTVSLVAITSVVGAVGAAAAFGVIGLFAQHPVRLFRIVAVVALALSFAMPLTIPGAPVAMVLSLEVMHVVACAVIVGLLTTLARKESGA